MWTWQSDWSVLDRRDVIQANLKSSLSYEASVILVAIWWLQNFGTVLSVKNWPAQTYDIKTVIQSQDPKESAL